MEFGDIMKAVENRERWKDIVATPSVVPRDRQACPEYKAIGLGTAWQYNEVRYQNVYSDKKAMSLYKAPVQS